MNLTRRQHELLEHVKAYRLVNGYSPTLQELADLMGTSKVTVFEHVEWLERKGFIRRNPHKSRSIQVLDAPQNPEVPDVRTLADGILAMIEADQLDDAKQVLRAVIEATKDGAVALAVAEA